MGEKRLDRPPAADRIGMWPAWLVLACALAGTWMVWRGAEQQIERQLRGDFVARSTEISNNLRQRLGAYTQLLRSAAGLFAATDQVSRDDWRNFVEHLKLAKTYPAIQAMAFARLVPGTEAATLVRQIRATEIADFALRPPGQRERYVVNVYSEPYVGLNVKALGYDMWQDAIRRKAMQMALDSDEPAITQKVVLKVDESSHPVAAFIMYLPVHHRASEQIIGFVLSPFRMPALVADLLTPTVAGVALSIYDGLDAREETLLYRSGEAEPGHTPRFTTTEAITVGGHQWSLAFASEAALENRATAHLPYQVLAIGLVFSLLLFGITWSVASTRRRALMLAETMTATLRANDERFRDFSSVTADWWFWEMDAALRFTYFSPNAASVVGRPITTLIGKSRLELLAEMGPNTGIDVSAHLEDLQQHRPFKQFEYRGALLEGRYRWVSISGVPIFDDTGKFLGYRGTGTDITGRKEAEQGLQLAQEAFTNSREAIIVTDDQGIMLDVNPAFSRITGYAHEEAVGRSPRLLQSGRQDQHFYAGLWRSLLEQGSWEGEFWNKRKNGQFYAQHTRISAVRDKAGRITRFVAVASDVTQLRENHLRMEHLAYHDPLTNLPNRTLLTDRLKQAIAQADRRQDMLAVCYLDLDGFKPINDVWGHAAGDQLLIEVARRLSSHLRTGDTVARLGGDEFVILLGDADDLQEVEQAIRRILAAIASPFHNGSMNATLTASIGVALYPNDGQDPDTLIRHADQAMYASKQAGRNRHHLFDSEGERRQAAHHQAVSRMAEGLERDEFCLFYQPKVNMRSGEVVGVEALIRWQHPQQGLLSPVSFLPMVENSDLSIRLGEWVLHQALRQMTEWAGQGLQLPICVNISARHLQQEDFVAQLSLALAKYPAVRPEWLELEILETAAMDDIEAVSRIIAACSELGVGFALDDFGTGYSSLTYFRRLPTKVLKIDQSFVRDMLDDPDDLAIVAGVISLAQTFQRLIVAEGVETVAHGLPLIRLGCHLAQGYAIAHPMPAAQIPAWIAQWRAPPAWTA